MEKLAGTANSVVASDSARAFDGVATAYDRTFDAQPLTQQLRSRIYKIIEDRIAPVSSILDMNCGTGTDALHLAAKGHLVVGIDVSANMIACAEEKRRFHGLRSVYFQRASFQQLSHSDVGKYDLVLSNFGGLNCTPDLALVCTEVARVVKPNGFFIAVVMPPFSIWETASALLRGNARLARRRWSRTAQAEGFGSESFKVWYHTADTLCKAFRSAFSVEKILGLNIASPPPHAHHFTRRHPRLTWILHHIDSWLGSVPLLRTLGDHIVIVFRRMSD